MKMLGTERPTSMLTRKCIATLCFIAMVVALVGGARAQTAEDRYIADRDTAIARFTPERVPKIEAAQTDEEEKARSALEKQMLAILGPVAPKGFVKPKLNLGSLFTGDMDFGKLDGLVFEADAGRTQMIVTTLPLLQRWLKSKEEFSKDPDQAIGGADFFMHAVQTDAAILHYADLPLGAPRTFAMLSARTQDRAPLEASEVYVAAIRGDRVFVASAKLKRSLAVPACNRPRQAADKKIEAMSEAQFKPGEDNSEFVGRLSKLRDKVDEDFQKCFAQHAPKDPRFAAAVARAKELYDRMPVK